MLSKVEFKKLNRPVSIIPFLLLMGDWMLILCGIFLLKSPLTFAFGFLLLMRQQLSLSVMMHEGVHNLLLENKRMNDLLGIFFCSGPILSHFHGYRNLHMKHHRHALSSEDPGQYLLKSHRESPRAFILDILKDLSFITYISLGFKVDTGKITKTALALNLLGQVFGLIMVWVLFKLFGLSFSYYIFCWVIPLVTIHQVVLRIRALMEHGGFSYHKEAEACNRSVKAGWVTKILAPHNINYHIEHHLYPTIPSYRLVHISKKLSFNNREESYGNALKSLFMTSASK
ncbi:MAG: fatty acid desaturase family protein [Bdellovibrionales bacterium]|nr:fatty acid desaturase family protein [Bdellovibrionales bacterium]